MFNLVTYASVVILVTTCKLKTASSSHWPYLQIYPQVNETDHRTPLYFALVLSTGGQLSSIGVLPGVQVALDYINSDPSVLPGYSLHYTLTDSQCERYGTIRSFFEQVLSEPTKVGWVGSGCSLATEFTAELTPFYNITQISCVSALPEVNDQKLLRYYLQTLPTTDILGYGFLSLILHFDWKKVSIITQNEAVFTRMMDRLKQGLNVYGIEYSETLFTEVEDVGDSPYESGARIFIWATYPPHARTFACEAHKRGLRYPKHQFLIFGWYQEGWLLDPPFTTSQLDCTAEERASTVQYSLTVKLLDFERTNNETAVGAVTLMEFLELVQMKYNSPINSHLGLQNGAYNSPYLCYEATLSLAFALKTMMQDIDSNHALNMEAGREAGLSEGETFTLANFSYSNSAIVQRMFHHLISTDFIGITGRRVTFNDKGRRVLRTIQIGQNRPNGDFTDHVEIGLVREASLYNLTPEIPEAKNLWPNGTPTDGKPIKKIATVSVSNIVSFSLLGILGITYSLACIIFNFINRHKKVIRLSSPNLNYLIGIGAILIYLDLIIIIIRHETITSLVIVYNMSTWLVSIGNTLCFGTISSKMIRVWYIFNNPTLRKKFTIKDHHLALIVALFVIIDLIILGTYTIIEGARGNLRAVLIRSAEQPDQLVGPTAEVHRYYFYATFSTGAFIWYTIISFEKVIFYLIALFLAIRTRKVKMKGLDDSKFVIAATYATNLFFLTGVIGLVSAGRGFFNVFIALFGGNTFISTTTILSLVFIPKMVAIYKDPTGENVGGGSIEARSLGPSLECAAVAQREREKDKLQRLIRRLESQLEQHTEGAVVSLEDTTAANETMDCPVSTNANIETVTEM